MEIRDPAAYVRRRGGVQHLGLVLVQAGNVQRVAQVGALTVREPDCLVQAVGADVEGGGGAEVRVTLDGFHDGEGDDARGGRGAGGQFEDVPVGDLRGLADGDGVVGQVFERHGAVLGLQGLDGGVGDGTRVEGVGAVGGDGFECVGVAFPRDGLVEAL